LKLNQLKDPFQRAKIAVSPVWTALAVFLGCHLRAENRGFEIRDEVRQLLITLNSWQNWEQAAFCVLLSQLLSKFDYSLLNIDNNKVVRARSI
jgi:hypothetical protein